MKWVGRISFGVAALLGAKLALCATAAEPPLAGPSASNSAASGSPRVRVQLPPDPSDTPMEPVAQSPVMFFRELLPMNAVERKQALTNRPPENQKVILAKLREYAAMDLDRREERLQATEMRWYLEPLLTSPATNRAEQLVSVPVRNRKLLEDRLQEWDKLPASIQKSLLASKDTLIYLTEIAGLTSEQRRRIIEGMSPARRQKLQAGVAKWNRIPPYERQRLVSRFNQFFDLTKEEKEKALRTLSGPERQQIERTLQTFENLPPDQRAKCVRAIAQYTSLSLEERQQFLKNAERWKLLTPRERQQWRDLVNVLPPVTLPPLPPDLPPLPPDQTSPRRPAPLVTNGN